jgi:hypothetical protein
MTFQPEESLGDSSEVIGDFMALPLPVERIKQERSLRHAVFLAYAIFMPA